MLPARKLSLAQVLYSLFISYNVHFQYFVYHEKHYLEIIVSKLDHAAQDLGQVLRKRRKALGINMSAAAEAAQISRVTWHRLEKGEATVALRSLLAAANVLGMRVKLDDLAIEPQATLESSGWLPRIGLTHYPALRALAWQISNDATILSPREAFGLYQRNWRHVDVASLSAHEQALIDGLKELFGGDWPGI